MNRRALPIVIALFFTPCVALADAPSGGKDAAAAQSLFYDARKLMEAFRYRDACPKLEESLRLDPGIGTSFNLADCDEHLGKIATAWARFVDVAARSKLANQRGRETIARKRAAALEPRLPKVIIELTGPSPRGLEVKRDGVVVGEAAWGTSIPVDPGTHRISASAPGKRTWHTTVQTSEATITRVQVPRDLPDGAVEVASAPGAPAQSPQEDGVTTSASARNDVVQDFPPPIVESRGATQRALGWVFAGVGTAGLGVAAGFGLASIDKRNESRAHCIGDTCDGAGLRLRDDALRNGNIATIATIAGGAAIAGGLILLLTAPSRTSTRERVGTVRAAPTAAIGGGGLSIEGKF